MLEAVAMFANVCAREVTPPQVWKLVRGMM